MFLFTYSPSIKILPSILGTVFLVSGYNLGTPLSGHTLWSCVNSLRTGLHVSCCLLFPLWLLKREWGNRPWRRFDGADSGTWLVWTLVKFWLPSVESGGNWTCFRTAPSPVPSCETGGKLRVWRWTKTSLATCFALPWERSGYAEHAATCAIQHATAQRPRSSFGQAP